MTIYTETFRNYIHWGTEHALAQVQATPGLLSDEVRTQALHLLSYALDLADAWPSARDLLLAMAPKMEMAGHRDSWIVYLKKGLAQGAAVGDRIAEAQLHRQLAFLLQLRSKFDQARFHYTASAMSFAEAGDPYRQAQVLGRLAHIEYWNGDPQEALALVQTVFAILSPADPERAICHLTLGWYAYHSHDYRDAQHHFAVALAFAEQQNDQRQIARRLRDLGNTLQGQRRYKESLACYLRANTLFTQLQDHYEQAVTNMNLAALYLLQEMPHEALELLLPAEVVFQGVQDQLHMALVQLNQGIAYRDIGEFEQAESLLVLAIEQWHLTGSMGMLVNTLNELGILYLKQCFIVKAEAVLQQAIKHLHQLQGQPGYEYYLATVLANLQESQNRQVCGDNKGQGNPKTT
jgi:tetratricopeptide (TPR) repeat protein